MGKGGRERGKGQGEKRKGKVGRGKDEGAISSTLRCGHPTVLLAWAVFARGLAAVEDWRRTVVGHAAPVRRVLG